MVLHQPSEFWLPLDPLSKEKLPNQRPCTHHEFLDTHRDCAYTTFITVAHQSAVPVCDFHCQRLLTSITHLHEKRARYLTLSHIRDHLLATVSSAQKNYANHADELQVVCAIVPNGDDGLDLRMQISLITVECDPSPVQVECHCGPRRQPRVKNTSWYTKRKPIEASRMEGTSETILLDIDSNGDHLILEGLVTNVFVVTKDLKVYTAPSNLVLPGSMRKLVLLAGVHLGISVLETSPKLEDFREFEAAFLTNARRLLTPVQSINIPDRVLHGPSIPSCIHLNCGVDAKSLIYSLRSIVVTMMKEDATALLRGV